MKQLKELLDKNNVSYNEINEKMFIDIDELETEYNKSGSTLRSEINALTGFNFHGSMAPKEDGTTDRKMWVTLKPYDQ